MAVELKFSVDNREVLEFLKSLRHEEIVTAWSEAILQLAKRQAVERIGGRFGREEIADFIEVENHGDTATIKMNRQNAYIGEHVHFGGPIRSRNGRALAIPLPNESSAKYNPQRLFARNVQEKLFVLTSKKGNRLLFRQPGKKEPLEKPLFVLKNETRPQRPRPWWPTQAEAEAATGQFFNDNF